MLSGVCSGGVSGKIHKHVPLLYGVFYFFPFSFSIIIFPPKAIEMVCRIVNGVSLIDEVKSLLIYHLES